MVDSWQALPYLKTTETAETQAEAAGTEQAWAIDRRLSVSAGVSLPMKNRHLGLLSYRWDRRTAADAESAAELGYPDDGREDFARLEFGYRYSFSRRYPYSVGLEHGRSIALAGRWYSKALGGDFE